MPVEKIAAVGNDVHPLALGVMEEAGFEVRQFGRGAPDTELLDALEGAQILGLRTKPKISKHVIENAGSLLVIACFSSGTEHIDVPRATDLGIPVLNTHDNAESVAQHTLMVFDMLARRVLEHHDGAQRGIWTKTAEDSHELAGMTVGIFGLGAVGWLVAERALQREMKVLYYDPFKPQEYADGVATKVEDKDDIFRNSDFVSLHCNAPGDGSTMTGAEQLALMRKGSYIINTARAELLDEKALIAAINSGHLGGAAIDVHLSEPSKVGMPFTSRLIGLRNVIVTPHTGASTEEAQEKIGSHTALRAVDLVDSGNIMGSVNFPSVGLEEVPGMSRLAYTHHNMTGALEVVTAALTKERINIGPEESRTQGPLGYALFDLESPLSSDVMAELLADRHTIRIRAI